MKKSIFIICALLLFNLSSFAQMTITPYAQADLTYRILSPESTLSVENIENVKEMYTPKLGYTFGANLQYDFNEKWQLSVLGNYNTSQYYFQPSQRNSTLGVIDFALQLNVEFEGQEIDEFNTYMGGIALTNINKQHNYFLKLF